MSSDTGAPWSNAGYLAMDSLSAEKSYRHWHADLGAADTPLEAAIGFTVLPKLKRADSPRFIGREALEAQWRQGVRRRLVTLVIEPSSTGESSMRPLHGGEILLRDGHPVGLVRSTAFGHTLGATIVTGYVACPLEIPQLTPGWLKKGSWAISSRCSRVLPATLHLKPPFDPEGRRIHGDYSDSS